MNLIISVLKTLNHMWDQKWDLPSHRSLHLCR